MKKFGLRRLRQGRKRFRGRKRGGKGVKRKRIKNKYEHIHKRNERIGSVQEKKTRCHIMSLVFSSRLRPYRTSRRERKDNPGKEEKKETSRQTENGQIMEEEHSQSRSIEKAKTWKKKEQCHRCSRLRRSFPASLKKKFLARQG